MTYEVLHDVLLTSYLLLFSIYPVSYTHLTLPTKA